MRAGLVLLPEWLNTGEGLLPGAIQGRLGDCGADEEEVKPKREHRRPWKWKDLPMKAF